MGPAPAPAPAPTQAAGLGGINGLNTCGAIKNKQHRPMDPPPVKDTLTRWIALDDEQRKLRNRIKEIQDEKTRLGADVLTFMRDNEVDDFKTGRECRVAHSDSERADGQATHQAQYNSHSDAPSLLGSATEGCRGPAGD